MRLFGILALLFGAGAITVSAQTNAPEIRRLSLEDCLEIALHHNLDVQIKRYSPEILRYGVEADYGAYDPTISIQGTHNYSVSPGSVDAQGRSFGSTERESDSFNAGFSGLLPWGLTYDLGGNLSDSYGLRTGTNGGAFESTGGTIGALQLRQPLLKNFWIDSTRLAIYLDRKNLQISELDLRFQVMNSITSVEAAYYGLIAAQESVIVQQKALELAERQLAENRKRVEVGSMAQLDEKQAESLAAQSRADLLAAMGNEQTKQRVLKNLLSDDYSKWKDAIIAPVEKLVAIPQHFNLQESWRNGLSKRPDLLQQKLVLDQQSERLRFQRNQLYPELDLVGNYGYNASSREFSGAFSQIWSRDNPTWSYGAVLTIPLTQRTARNNYRSAKATREQMELQSTQLEQRVLIGIEDAIANANTSYQRVAATREARIYSEAALDAEQKKLESGKSTSFIVLQLTRDLTSARSAEISALAQYNIDLANAAFSEGSTLERRHISLQWK